MKSCLVKETDISKQTGHRIFVKDDSVFFFLYYTANHDSSLVLEGWGGCWMSASRFLYNNTSCTSKIRWKRIFKILNICQCINAAITDECQRDCFIYFWPRFLRKTHWAMPLYEDVNFTTMVPLDNAFIQRNGQWVGKLKENTRHLAIITVLQCFMFDGFISESLIHTFI